MFEMCWPRSGLSGAEAVLPKARNLTTKHFSFVQLCSFDIRNVLARIGLFRLWNGPAKQDSWQLSTLVLYNFALLMFEMCRPRSGFSGAETVPVGGLHDIDITLTITRTKESNKKTLKSINNLKNELRESFSKRNSAKPLLQSLLEAYTP